MIDKRAVINRPVSRHNINMKYKTVKRAIDVVISVLAIPVLMPLLVLIAVLICVDSRGSPVFRQERRGEGGRPFTCYKFRTMKTDAPHYMTKSEMTDSSLYLTRAGKWLRKSSLDELPQLFNVLKGDMSLIGPRPVIDRDEKLLELRSLYGAQKAKPGITGLAQVCGRDMLSPNEKAMLDRFYTQYMSFGSDLVIFLYTIEKVIGMKNVKH